MNEQLVEGGYDVKLVKEDKNLECPICLLLLREAMGTQCRHLLCKVCLEKLQRSSDDAGRDFICPTCKEKIDVNQVYANVYIDSVVTGSDVYCLRQESGCQWVGTLAAYLREHHEKCDYVIISCDNNGCGDKLRRNLMKQHAEECPYSLVNCIYCQMEVKFIQLDEHLYTECQKIPVDCVMGCGVQVPREKMDEHLDEVCGLVEVECQFSNAGCSSKIQRMDAQKHNVEFTQIHMSFLLDKLNKSQRKIEQLEIANSQSQKKMKQLEVANDQSRNEVQQLKETISQMEQLNTTNSLSQHEMQANETFKGLKCEAAGQLNPTAVPYIPLVNEGQDLATLLHKGVEKWIDKKQIRMKLTYSEWYRIVDKKMERYSVHEYDDFVFVKVVKNRQHKVIRWRFTLLPLLGLLRDKRLHVVTSGTLLDVTSSLALSSMGNRDCFICHWNYGMEQMNYIAAEAAFGEKCFSLDLVPSLMRLSEEVILCARRKPGGVASNKK